MSAYRVRALFVRGGVRARVCKNWVKYIRVLASFSIEAPGAENDAFVHKIITHIPPFHGLVAS